LTLLHDAVGLDVVVRRPPLKVPEHAFTMIRLLVAITALALGVSLQAQRDSQVSRIVIKAEYAGLSDGRCCKTWNESTTISRSKRGYVRPGRLIGCVRRRSCGASASCH
jgi:hypothetical protein